MTRTDILAAGEWARTYFEGGDKYRLRARGELVHLGRNDEPHFSLTGTVQSIAPSGYRRQMAAGAIHGRILDHFPHLEPLRVVHLSSHEGVPLHAYFNAAWYAGHTRHGAFDLRCLALSLRTTQDTAQRMLDYIADYWGELDAVTTPTMAWRDACEEHGLVDQWQAEANAALALLTRAAVGV